MEAVIIAPRLIALARSPLGFALWNRKDFTAADVDERYIRVSDCVYLLSIIDTLVEAAGGELDPDDLALIAQIRADLAQV